MAHVYARADDVPPRALVLSVAALAVPIAGAIVWSEPLGEHAALLWLLALVPAFLLAYYRGWRGVATALAVGMATLSVTEAVATWLGSDVPDLLLGVVVVYLGVSLGIGWLAEVLHGDREAAEDLAFTDLLTHLPNRRHAHVFLENEFAAAERGRLLSVVLFDLDHFKRYNDSYGHPAGDEALRIFAEILTRTTRRMNLSARFGGEEFLTVLAGSDAEGAVVFAERVRTALRGSALGGEEPLTVSAGVAEYRPEMRAPDELLAAADHALYEAKREARDCVRLFGPPDGNGAAPPAVPRREVAGAAASPRTGLRPRGAATAPSDSSSPPPVVSEDSYPRGGDELGKTRPPVSLLPPDVPIFGKDRRILLVEDEDAVRDLLSTYLRKEGFDVEEASDVAAGVRRLDQEFDVVVTDIRLPDASGNELVAAVKTRWPASQVIVITGLQDAHVAAEALNAGADRYLFKPFGMPELRAHLYDALQRRERSVADRAERRLLSNAARERAEQARNAVLKGTRALVRAVEVRDPYTRGHSDRVARYAAIVASTMDPEGTRLPPDALRLACELHDVGKIGVSDAVLNKEGRLTPDEIEQVRLHPRTGRRILEPLLDDEIVLSVVSWHHEQWDGKGYPDGLAGETIPLAARVVGLCDALDAMTSNRAYRTARPWDEAVRVIRELAGMQFDPDLVRVMDGCLPELEAARRKIDEEQAAREGD